jgi:hypothetical protein
MILFITTAVKTSNPTRLKCKSVSNIFGFLPTWKTGCSPWEKILVMPMTDTEKFQHPHRHCSQHHDTCTAPCINVYGSLKEPKRAVLLHASHRHDTFIKFKRKIINNKQQQ